MVVAELTGVAEKNAVVCRADGSGAIEQFTQAEPCQRGLAAPADEFAADAVARIIAGLVNCNRHATLSQPDAQRQSREAAADNVNWLWRGHFQEIFFAMNRWLNAPAECSVSSQFFLSGQSDDNSWPENPARNAHDGVVARHSVAGRSPKAAGCKTAATRRGAARGATNNFACREIFCSNDASLSVSKWCRNKFAMTVSPQVCGQSKTSATTASARQPSWRNQPGFRRDVFLQVEQTSRWLLTDLICARFAAEKFRRRHRVR